ncbi:MAG: hypothetical protein ACE5O2_16155 [Armatimonadota bacterium]
MKEAMSLILSAVAGCAAWAQQSPLQVPEVWMCHGRPWELAKPDAKWEFVRANLDGIKLYIDALRRAPQERLQALADVLKRADIKVAVECGGTLGFAPLDDTNGEKSAEIELAKLKRWTDAGGQLHYLDLDGPVRRLLYPPGNRQGFASIERCIKELVDYTKAVRAVYPRIEFFALTNFPNWGYKGDVSYHARGPKRQDWGDYYDVITTIIRLTREADVPIKGLTCDNPYEYAVGEHRSVMLGDPREVDWLGRIRDLEKYVEGEGLEFNLICNSEAGGQESAQAFYERTLRYLDTYLAAGGTPKRYIIQTWYPHPREVLPETEPHTMTALVKEVIQRLRAHGASPRE